MSAAARHRARHRKPLRPSRERGFHSGGTAARSVRPHTAAAAAVALAGASVIAVAPAAPPPKSQPVEIDVASPEVRLAAASLLNVPINLITDIINIPYNEVQALNELSSSLFFSGPWFVVSATNIWGVDPGDPGHFMSTIDVLVPFPALSGLGLDQSDTNGLGQQVWHFVAAELPVNKFCDADGCAPGVPISPITGITSVDQTLWGLALTFGLYGFAPGAWVQFPLYKDWFSVPLSELLSGYTFGPDQPGYVDPSGPVFPGFGFAGTTVGPNGENLMPWANTTFQLDLTKPFQNYFNHLMADPATNPIRLPSLEEIGRTIQTLLAAAVVAFDPLTPGSGLCTGGLGNCSWLPPALDYPGIVRFIGSVWPGNTLIDQWLNAYDTGTANVPTQEQIDNAQKLANQNGSFWDFGNPAVPSELISGFNLGTLAPFFHNVWSALGLNPPPLATPEPAPDPEPSIAALKEPQQGDVELDSMGQVGEGQQSNGVDTLKDDFDKGLRAFEKLSQRRLPSVEDGLDNAQPAAEEDAAGTTTTSTDATDESGSPKGIDDGTKADGKKSGPRHARGNDTPPSANATDDAGNPKGTDNGTKADGKKAGPRHALGNDTTGRGSAAPKAKRDQSQSSDSKGTSGAAA